MVLPVRSAPGAEAASAASAASAAQPVVLQLNPNDILLGRGKPAIFNEGNIRFRKLVISRKEEYITTTIRQRKDAIARKIMDEIARRNGRFVRKVESLIEAEQLGVPKGAIAYVQVDDEQALLKVKQALRALTSNDPSEKMTAETVSSNGKTLQSKDFQKDSAMRGEKKRGREPETDLHSAKRVEGQDSCIAGGDCKDKTRTSAGDMLSATYERFHLKGSNPKDLDYRHQAKAFETKPIRQERAHGKPRDRRNMSLYPDCDNYETSNAAALKKAAIHPNTKRATIEKQIQEGVTCDLVDTLALTVLCLRGLPVTTQHLSTTTQTNFAQARHEFPFSWSDFHTLLATMTEDRYPDLLKRGGISWDVLSIAKRTTYILKEFHREGSKLSMANEQNKANDDAAVLEESILSWLNGEIDKWESGWRMTDGTRTVTEIKRAHSFKDDDQSIALTSENRGPMTAFLPAQCRTIVLQIASLTRLRSIFVLPGKGISESMPISGLAVSLESNQTHERILVQLLLSYGYESLLVDQNVRMLDFKKRLLVASMQSVVVRKSTVDRVWQIAFHRHASDLMRR